MLKGLVLLGLLPLSLLGAPSHAHPEGRELYVLARAGLYMRETPSSQGKIVLKVPFGSKVRIAANYTPGAALVHGITGAFAPILFEGKRGFAFDGYLSAFPAPPAKCTDLRDFTKVALEAEGPLQSLKPDPEKSETSRSVQRYKGGAFLETIMYLGGGYTTLHLPSATVKDGYLILAACFAQVNKHPFKLDSTGTFKIRVSAGTWDEDFMVQPWNSGAAITTGGQS